MNKYVLPDLPYGYGDLEPYISEEIMKLHHDKHHAGYVNKLNEAIEKYPELFDLPAQAGKSPEELLKDLNNIPEDIRGAVRNNGGGHVNHSIFWEIMRPVRSSEGSQREVSNGVGPNEGGSPSGEIVEEINKQFGSFEEFKKKFEDEGVKRFGSGWVWLIKNKEGKLEVVSTANQDNPLSDGNYPIMGNDVWEHAYYLQYKNVRPDYLKAWWNVVNWEEVNKRLMK